MDIDPRDRFRKAADQVAPAPVDAIVSHGTRLRRQRRLGLVGGAVALVLVAAGVVGYQALKPAPKVALHVVGTPPVAATQPAAPTPTPSPGLSPTPSPAPPPKPSPVASPTPGAAPVTGITELSIEDTTWVSDRTGWVLGTARCQGTPCTVILHTTDGGASWSRVAAPPETVVNLRFANTTVGYASGFDQGTLYMTTDGGRTWLKQAAPANVEDLEISNGTVYAIVTGGSGCPAACGPVLEASPAGTASWRSLNAPAISKGFGERVIAQGPDLYYIAFGHPAGGAPDAQSTIARSINGGATWQTEHDPCGPTPTADSTSEMDAASLAAAPGGFVAVLCNPRQFGSGSEYVLTSKDAGTTFGPPMTIGTSTMGTIAAGSAANLAVAGFGVSVSHDGGATWNMTLPLQKNPTGTDFLGFEDATTARASLGAGTLYTTTDAGGTWTSATPAG